MVFDSIEFNCYTAAAEEEFNYELETVEDATGIRRSNVAMRSIISEGELRNLFDADFPAELSSKYSTGQ